MISSVIFDYGKVLCHAPDPRGIEEIGGLLDLDTAGFWTLFDRNRDLLDRGKMSTEEYWTEFVANAGKPVEPEQVQWLRRRDVELWSAQREEMHAWAAELQKAGHKTAILSNLNKEFAAHIRENCDWAKRFDVKVFSGEVGAMKPEPEIYRYVLRALKSAPDETLFIDDREENVAAAREEGMHALVYHSSERLCEELRISGWSLPSLNTLNAR